MDMEQWSEIRRRVLVEGLSKRAACREYGLHWHTLKKMLEHSEPPGYRAAQPRAIGWRLLGERRPSRAVGVLAGSSLNGRRPSRANSLN